MLIIQGVQETYVSLNTYNMRLNLAVWWGQKIFSFIHKKRVFTMLCSFLGIRTQSWIHTDVQKSEHIFITYQLNLSVIGWDLARADPLCTSGDVDGSKTCYHSIVGEQNRTEQNTKYVKVCKVINVKFSVWGPGDPRLDYCYFTAAAAWRSRANVNKTQETN